MKAWRINALGDPWDNLEVEDIARTALADGGCRIQVKAVDLNFADILQCQGSYQVKLEPPFTPGMNAAGEVLEINGDAPFKVGDHVVSTTWRGAGGYAEEALVPTRAALKLPDGVDPIKVAGMHVTYGTSWFGLHLRGKLQPGETVLVLAAAGGVGSSAVELAKVHGCRVIAAAGGDAKTAACTQMGADAVVDYNSEDLYERVMALTDNKGVDVVYDPVGGEYFDIARRLVAWEGRYLVIGFASGNIPTAPMNHTLVKNYDIVGVHMGGYRGRNNQAFTDCYDTLYDMLVAGKINPLIDSVVGFDGLPDALKQLADRKTKGRIIFDPAQ